ncbi:hypothetical protein LSH36_44g00022 [Paralvinella palmiformis]|uniref:Mitochondria-eating protein n=1 Tax=Paralvinella palmiformis TaxID=53620 RepID=A0AAD9NDD6_9ANNE|nr:hypothetical protein LSH36_44g00022 [Paralvinella palmiformis]
MAESLRRLVNLSSFSILQDKLERWLEDYHVNTCDQNVGRCCEVIELNAKVQAQLFKLLSLTASEGGMYGGASVIKSRLLPWLGQGIFTAGALTSDTSMGILAEVAAKDREINEIQDMYETSLKGLEADLSQTRVEADELKAELTETQNELESMKRQSTSEKMFTDAEVRELRSKLHMAEDEISALRNRANLVDSYERQIQHLRGDVAALTGRRDVMINGDSEPYKPLPRPASPFAPNDVTQRVRQQNLVSRFNDMYIHDRLEAMEKLRIYSDDHQNNQRIVFTMMQEAFTAAKLAFTSYKMRVRSNLSVTHMGPETLEEAVQDYINRNTDLYDLPALVSDVIRGLNRNPRIFLPPDVSYSIISPFIREACKLAWNMAALAHPLDITLASEAELYDDTRYRRSYDSDYTAPLVSHHIWPCLVQGLKVIVKGECCTLRGASLNMSRSHSPIRARSPTRAISPSRARSRSPSPRRIDSVMSGRSPSPGLRSRSPSRASSRAVTASTSLSHYGVRS